MDVGEFCNLITDMEEKVVAAIQSGAQWEVWLQVEIFGALIRNFGCGGREIRRDGARATDLAFTHDSTVHMVELKVESAHHAGQFAGVSLSDAVDADVEKLRRLNVVGHKWSCCIAWSRQGKEALQGYGFNYIAFGDSVYVGVKTA
ncbi:hypothetical protein ACXYTJ_08015 [Gilvimarinus sp. F26214L]|uniref:hypothetical protein n=1 Tax=Gilvimarinus sp. DZF01 TaxID=3461371 RepID=UPI004045A6BA